MTLHIPIWLLLAIGIPLGLGAIFLMVMGIMFLSLIWNFRLY